MTAIADPRALAALPLFRGLGEADLAHLAERLRRRNFPAGSHVITAEQPGEALYIVESGSVKVYLDELDGSQVIFAFLGPGDSLGEMSLVDHEARSANVVTLEDSVLLWMDRATFLDCLRTHPVLAYNLVRELSARLRQANRQIRALTTLDVAGRVARQLLGFAAQYGRAADLGEVRIPLPLSQREIAEIVGATRERVNKVLVGLKRRGAISVDPQHRITIHDRAELERLCAG